MSQPPAPQEKERGIVQLEPTVEEKHNSNAARKADELTSGLQWCRAEASYVFHDWAQIKIEHCFLWASCLGKTVASDSRFSVRLIKPDELNSQAAAPLERRAVIDGNGNAQLPILSPGI